MFKTPGNSYQCTATRRRAITFTETGQHLLALKSLGLTVLTVFNEFSSSGSVKERLKGLRTLLQHTANRDAETHPKKPKQTDACIVLSVSKYSIVLFGV